MTRNTLHTAVDTAKEEMLTALQTVYDSLNSGQKKKLVRDEKVKALLDRYGVKYDE